MTLLTILSFLSVFVSGVKNDPNLPAGVRQGLGDASGALDALFAGMSTNGGSPLNPSTVLALLAGVVQSLKTDPNLPARVLDQIAVLDRAVAASLKADAEAKLAVDWNTESTKTVADGPDVPPAPDPATAG